MKTGHCLHIEVDQSREREVANEIGRFREGRDLRNAHARPLNEALLIAHPVARFLGHFSSSYTAVSTFL